MAVSIRMYKGFYKKLNSTKTPGNSDEYYTFDCVFLDSQSIMNPVIVIEDQGGTPVSMTEFTYAYIPDLARYYFISNSVISNNTIFTYYLQVDVLGSFKTDFLSTSQYVLRSTNVYNDDLIDNIYPIVPMPNATRFSSNAYASNTVYVYDNKNGTYSDRNLFHVTYSDGAILFGVTGQGNVAVEHYITSVSSFQSFINDVVTAVPTGGSWGNIPTGVQTALSNFLQYITYVKWIPFFPILNNVGSSVSTIYLGDESFSISGCYKVVAGLNNQPLRFQIQVPHHPLYTTHRYYNLSPFREVNLFYPLIGNIPLDTTKLYDEFTENNVYVEICMIIDLATADTEYTVINKNGFVAPEHFTDNLLANGITNIGVDLSLTEYSMSVEAAIASGLSYLVSNSINTWIDNKRVSDTPIMTTLTTQDSGGGGGHSFGDTSGGGGGHSFGTGTRTGIVDYIKSKLNAQDIASGIYDAIGNVFDLSPIANALGSFSSFVASSFGQVSTSGHCGSFLMSVCTMPVVYCWFKKHTAEDYNRFGRPCSSTVTLSTVSGFCVCRGANYSGGSTLHPLKPEIEAVNKLLNTGIYIES